MNDAEKKRKMKCDFFVRLSGLQVCASALFSGYGATLLETTGKLGYWFLPQKGTPVGLKT